MAFALPDLLGYTAAGLVLLTFSARSITALRSVAIASNLAFIAYALVAQLPPVLILHVLLLPLNTWRLWQARHPDASRRVSTPIAVWTPTSEQATSCSRAQETADKTTAE